MNKEARLKKILLGLMLTASLFMGAGAANISVVLHWASPMAQCGFPSLGKCASYDGRVSSDSAAFWTNWDNLTAIPNMPIPSAVGQTDSVTVQQASGTTFFYANRGVAPSGDKSPLLGTKIFRVTIPAVLPCAIGDIH
jgi:hypothetical protein